MNHPFDELMRDAARLTRAGQLREATEAIQRALGRGQAAPLDGVIDGCVFEVPPRGGHPEAGEFVGGSHTHRSLMRQYKLYVPPGHAGGSLPLVVMLHGCSQDPDDFAAGTGMNALADEQGFCVLYPAQAQDANPSRCWNWFKHNHQSRERGEAALIGALTETVIRSRGIDPGRVYIAGMSAGGAMAALVAAAHPELFAAVGVHSGLPPGAASNLPEGLAAMRAGTPATMMPGPSVLAELPVPAIVFHGSLDRTVHPSNADGIVAAVLRSAKQADSVRGSSPDIEQGIAAGGRRYTRSTFRAGSGEVAAEHWLRARCGPCLVGRTRRGLLHRCAGPRRQPRDVALLLRPFGRTLSLTRACRRAFAWSGLANHHRPAERGRSPAHRRGRGVALPTLRHASR